MRERVDTIFRKLSRHDPLFKGTFQVMEHYIRHLPGSAQRAVREMFARCPHEALEFYREIRSSAEKVAKT